MPLFHYQAVDLAGHSVRGELAATDMSAARQRLLDSGLKAVQVSPCGEQQINSAVRMERLRDAEAEEVLGHVAQVSMSQAPLSDGLRAAAAEAGNRRVSSALQFLAAEIDLGRAPADVLSDPSLRIPAHVRGLVTAAMRTGRLGPALDELIEHHRAMRYMFWNILGSLAYPLFVFVLSVVLLIFFLAWVVPQFDAMFQEMQLMLPAVTESVVFAGRTAAWLFLGSAKWIILASILGLVLLVYLAATGRGGASLQRMLEMTPLIGPLWAWSGASGFMYLLATLLEQRIALPEALRLTADGMFKADLRRAGAWLAAEMEKGQSLSELIEQSSCLPATTVPILRWGEQTGVLAEAARTLADLFAERVNSRTMWLRSAAPPVVYLFVVIIVGAAITSIFLPLVMLIRGLS